MTVDPSVVTLLREKTLIQMKKPKLSLDNPSISTLLTGNTFELVPGEGEPRNHFSVMPRIKRCWMSPTSPPLPSRRRKATASTAVSRWCCTE
ncbi:Paraquat-inducible protein B [Klebsiella pneumoniae]|uniref:Paraquat-inducible protein B n=1 Tax=Klebsiella pneumoniae TaxID=573 RepID=A0A377WMW3_KLEPN|nr:Paraquat-inducible protein B [Klebsiella pneumoniae]